MGEASKESLISTSSIIGGLVGGLFHAGVAVFLWNYFGFDNLWELLLIKPFNGMYIFLGMFALGFVPAMFYVGQKSVSPAIVVSVLLLLSGFGSWQAGPVHAPVGGPTPFGLYILFWVAVVALAGLAGEFEQNQKKPATG